MIRREVIRNMLPGYRLEIQCENTADLDSTYLIPTTLTVNGQSYDVIGVGDRAFRWASMSSGGSFDIVNTNLRYIADYALCILLLVVR